MDFLDKFRRYHDLLQFDPRMNPVSLTRGRFAQFPHPIPDSFSLDAVPLLRGYTLVQGRHNGVERFVIKTPRGKILAPSPDDRRVTAKYKQFNVANLLASSILSDDVTDNEYGILIESNGIWVESAADRLALTEELKVRCIDQCPRVELRYIIRPRSTSIDLEDCGYYVEEGEIYQNYQRYSKKRKWYWDHKRIPISRDGRVVFTTRQDKNKSVNFGLVLFTAYPSTYHYVPCVHTEVDHIDGNHENNTPWNLRPLTSHQNSMVAHRTGDRVQRPAPDSSHEKFKRETGELTRETVQRFIQEGVLKQYEETSYWMHQRGAVLKKSRGGMWTYAPLTVVRNGYTCSSGRQVHVMMCRAFGTYEEGKVVTHLDGNKENNSLENLKAGRDVYQQLGMKDWCAIIPYPCEPQASNHTF
jgi:hypothetical protein